MATITGWEETLAVDGVDRAAEPSDRELLARFAALRDETAFALLVRRHAAMVLGVCGRILKNEQDAEDAFQATFVVLAQKAGGLRNPELLANWLYGVASRIARKARGRAARRVQQERRAALMASVAAPPQEIDSRNEIRGILDEELEHLPPKYRTPLVLCYLEGMTNEQAARKLGWPSGSISYRLARGRQLLRDRLAKRTRAVPMAACDAALAEASVPVVVPPGLLQRTIKGALGDGGRPNLSPAVLALAAGAHHAAPGAGTALLKAALISLTLLGVAAAGAHAFGVKPPRTWFSPPARSPVYIPPTGSGCHMAAPG